MADETENVEPTPPAEFDFDAFVDELPEDRRTALTQYFERRTADEVAKVKNALDKERDNGKALAKQLKELASKATDAETLDARLKELSEKAAESTRKAAFLEGAVKSDLRPDRLDAAYRIAKVEGVIDDDGDVDWKAFKAAYPEFFKAEQPAKPPKSNGGNGVDASKTQPVHDVNAAIRRAVR